jgi:hypothetical protein
MVNISDFYEGRFFVQSVRLVRVIVNNTTLNAVQILPLPPDKIVKKYNLDTSLGAGIDGSIFSRNKWVIKLDDQNGGKIEYWGWDGMFNDVKYLKAKDF